MGKATDTVVVFYQISKQVKLYTKGSNDIPFTTKEYITKALIDRYCSIDIYEESLTERG